MKSMVIDRKSDSFGARWVDDWLVSKAKLPEN